MMWTKKNRLKKFEKKNVVCKVLISNWAKFYKDTLVFCFFVVRYNILLLLLFSKMFFVRNKKND